MYKRLRELQCRALGYPLIQHSHYIPLRMRGDKDSAPHNRTVAWVCAGGHGAIGQPKVCIKCPMDLTSDKTTSSSPPPKQKMAITAADTVLANNYNEEYPKQVWLLVAPFLFLVGVTRYGSVVLRKVFPGRGGHHGRVVRHAPSIRRLPLAIMNAYRVLAFRKTLSIGSFSLNFAEVALTIVYIVTLFVWSFINSEWCGTLLIH